jgi:hypothetical protein
MRVWRYMQVGHVYTVQIKIIDKEMEAIKWISLAIFHCVNRVISIYTQTTHALSPEGVVEACQIFLQDTHILHK